MLLQVLQLNLSVSPLKDEFGLVFLNQVFQLEEALQLVLDVDREQEVVGVLEEISLGFKLILSLVDEVIQELLDGLYSLLFNE